MHDRPTKQGPIVIIAKTLSAAQIFMTEKSHLAECVDICSSL